MHIGAVGGLGWAERAMIDFLLSYLFSDAGFLWVAGAIGTSVFCVVF